MSFAELLIILTVALLVIGPKQLPIVLRNIFKYWFQFKNMANEVSQKVQKDLQLEDIKADIHNDKVMADLNKFADSNRNKSINND